MKLFEIIQISQTEYKSPKQFNIARQVLHKDSSQNREVPNSGFYGKVSFPKNDPHIVRKTNHVADINLRKNDAYYNYIMRIVDGKLYDNPFFPRVYDVKLVTDSKSFEKYAIDMEKLESFTDLSYEELATLGMSIFGKDRFIRNLKSRFSSRNKIRFKTIKHPEYMAVTILEMIEGAILYGASTGNKKLDQAIRMIEETMRSGKFELDLHLGNVMIRRGGTGIQLVFTDPIKN